MPSEWWGIKCKIFFSFNDVLILFKLEHFFIAIQQAREYSKIFKVVFIRRVHFKYFLILEQFLSDWLPDMPKLSIQYFQYISFLLVYTLWWGFLSVPKATDVYRACVFPPSLEGLGIHNKLTIQNTNDGLLPGVINELATTLM